MSNINVEEIFGENVFTVGKMRERLPKKVFANLMNVMNKGGELSISDADVIAKAMKDWAVEKGATHYTHWFQPLTGITAEKHDAFVTHPDADGKMIMEFSGKELIKGEPDASSFPSGGLRATFEARGYTAWDCTSPAFVKEDATGAILCIPTAFCSYKGEALDKKTPLLRSMEAVSQQALRIVRLFGNTEATKVTASVGPEQEYFIVDREKYLERKDLIYTGRTLFGAPAPKGQELEDHYFGSIKERIGAYMKDINIELWKLGVTSKTQHNEVAPAQHELAPIYETANVAVDHNQLVMDVMKKVATRHGLACLLHEKPFAGVNGSGKHDNWSIVTDNGVNLIDPGDTPNENLQFLLVLACIMKAVDIHADLLRQSASDVGNDHRLGANEAPPAIISMFLGDQLEDVVNQIIETGTATHSIEGGKLLTGVSTLPDFAKDATDRNRTSPFAFTGNKFEFRMPGSSQSIAGPVTVLNTIMAEELSRFYAVLKEAPDFNKALHDLVRKAFIEHGRIIFNGNGYEEAWVEEAARRGLANLRSTADALPTYVLPKNVELMMKHGVYTKEEMFSRHEIHMEKYRKVIHIEAATMVDMVQHEILNAASEYESKLCETMLRKHEAAPELPCHVEKSLANSIGILNDKLLEQTVTLKTALETAPVGASGEEEMRYYHDVVAADMDAVRDTVDRLETLTAGKYWPYPTFYDLLFSV